MVKSKILTYNLNSASFAVKRQQLVHSPEWGRTEAIPAGSS